MAGVNGVAFATFLAEWTGLAFGLWLCRDAFANPRWRDWARVFEAAPLRRMAVVNTDILIRSMLLQAIFVSFLLLGGRFGDVTLVGTVGRLLSVVIMVLGVALFLRLIQTIFRPTRVAHECPDCGLNRHEADAVHCRHCGRVLHIATEGHEG